MKKPKLPVLSPSRFERILVPLTLRELEAASGIDVSILSKSERGLRGLSPEQERRRAEAIARASNKAAR